MRRTVGNSFLLHADWWKLVSAYPNSSQKSGWNSGGGHFCSPQKMFIQLIMWFEKQWISFLDTNLLQKSNLGMVIVYTLSLTLGKVVLQPGVQPLLPLLTLHLYLSLLSLFFLCSFFWGLLAPCKPFLIFLSVINLYHTDSILLYSAHIFFHLPPCLLPSSIALSPDVEESVDWLQEHELDIWKEEHNTLLCQAHWPCSHILRTSSFQ